MEKSRGNFRVGSDNKLHRINFRFHILCTRLQKSRHQEFTRGAWLYKAVMNIFPAFLVFLLASPGFASELAKLNAAWLLDNEKLIRSQLQVSSNIEVMPIINTLGIIWQNRDGAISSEVSPHIAQALIYKSESMLAWFNEHPESLEAWLQEIETNLLTNYTDSLEYSAYLANLKAQLASAMSSYSGSFKSEADKVLLAISKAQVREID